MRKKTVNHIADTIFWYALYFLPVIAFLLVCWSEPGSGQQMTSLNEFFSRSGFDIYGGNIIYESLYNVVGEEGLMPLFDNDYALYFVTWFASVYLVHLLVDFILFIPRLAHKWMNSFTRSE